MNLIFVIVVGVCLYFFFSLGKSALTKTSGRNKWIKRARAMVSYLEFAAWVIFYFWTVDLLFVYKSYYSALILSSVIVLLLLFVWYYLKDVLAGMVFRMQFHPKVGSKYTFDRYSGVIKEVRSGCLVLDTAEGEELKVPYSHLFGPVFEGRQQKFNGENKIRLRIKKTESKEVTTRKLREAILNSPWSALKNDPVIHVVSDDGEYYEFEVLLTVFNPSHLARIEDSLRADFS